MGDEIVNVWIDDLLLRDVRKVGIEYGVHDVTQPDDKVVSYRMNGRKEFLVETSGGIYPGKATAYEWSPFVVDTAPPVYTVEIETLDEWPNPCELCETNHDTLDCD
jgi:hypothetical protein